MQNADQTEALRRVAHLLPTQAQELVGIIGLSATLALVKTWGGTRFPVSKGVRSAGIQRYELLAETVGVAAADRLTATYGGQVLSVPRCYHALTELRDNVIRDEFDRRQRNESSNWIAADLAIRFGLTDRHVRRILKRTEREPLETNRRQLDLFSR